MNVIEIFSSIEGEGKRAGTLCTFVRFAGCNLRCEYCDTTYSFDVNKAKEMTPEEILNTCNDFGIKKVTITGGEPLLQKELNVLLRLFLENEYEVNIETNGSLNVFEIIKIRNKNIFYTIDYKTKSSNAKQYMSMDNYYNLRKRDVLKFVVGNKEDLNDAKKLIRIVNPNCNIYFSPIWGKIDPIEIVDFMKEEKLTSCKIQIQIHKIIWNPDMRGV